LQPLKRLIEVARGRLRGPALADLSDLAGLRKLAQSSKRLGVI
jgi:hypothetical protein